MAESSGPPSFWMRCPFCSSMTNEPEKHLRSRHGSEPLIGSGQSLSVVVQNMILEASRFTANQIVEAEVLEVTVRNHGGCANDLTCVYDLLARLNIKILDKCDTVLRRIRSTDSNRTPVMCLLISELLTGVDGNVVIKPEEIIARLKRCLKTAEDVNTRGSLPPVFCSKQFLGRLPFHLDPKSVSPIEMALLAGNLFAIYALMKVGARYSNEMLSRTLAEMKRMDWEWTVCGVRLYFHVERNKALFIEYVDKIVLLSTKSLAVLASLALSKQVESQEEIEEHLAEFEMPSNLISIRKPNFDDDEAYDYTIRGTMKDIV